MFERVAQLQREGRTVALVTVIAARGSVPRHEGSKMLVFPDGTTEGTIGGGEMESRVIQQAVEALRAGRSRILNYEFRDPDQGDVGVCGGELDVYVEPVAPQPTILIVGAGHVGQAVAHLARWLGMRVVVSDDRPGFATEETVPEADEHLACEIGEIPQRLNINEQTYILLTTRGVALDVEGLPALLATPAAYIGVIGSRRRWETCAQILRELDVDEALIARVTSPMGLELNAETPEEIALSMLAEIVMLRRGGTGEPMGHDASRSYMEQGSTEP